MRSLPPPRHATVNKSGSDHGSREKAKTGPDRATGFVPSQLIMPGIAIEGNCSLDSDMDNTLVREFGVSADSAV